MLKNFVLFILILCSSLAQSQITPVPKDSTAVNDSIVKKAEFLKQLGNGFLPTKYINLDLRYLLKFNQYEGLRTGLGGVTNENFSKKYRINSYVVYGFRDHTFK